MALKSELVSVGFFANQADAAIGGSVETGITADTGSAQADSYQLTKTMSVIATCATAGDSVILPKAASTGDEIWVRNNGANSADVFPQVGGAINGVPTTRRSPWVHRRRRSSSASATMTGLRS